MGELGLHIVVLHAEKRVLGEGVDVQPHRVARGGRGKLPVDGCLTTTLAVHLDMQWKELPREPRAHVYRRASANSFGHHAHLRNEVVRMALIIYENFWVPGRPFSFGPHSW